MLDVNLPKHNGDAVLRHVRRQSWLEGVPVIMLTSSASPADRAAAIELGANLYLQKSSDLDELLEVGKIVEAFLRAIQIELSRRQIFTASRCVPLICFRVVIDEGQLTESTLLFKVTGPLTRLPSRASIFSRGPEFGLVCDPMKTKTTLLVVLLLARAPGVIRSARF